MNYYFFQFLQMQSIFYHNFSGNSAFTGNLKTKEVHRAITLHPIKHHQHMYRVHNYMQVMMVSYFNYLDSMAKSLVFHFREQDASELRDLLEYISYKTDFCNLNLV